MNLRNAIAKAMWAAWDARADDGIGFDDQADAVLALLADPNHRLDWLNTLGYEVMPYAEGENDWMLIRPRGEQAE